MPTEMTKYEARTFWVLPDDDKQPEDGQPTKRLYAHLIMDNDEDNNSSIQMLLTVPRTMDEIYEAIVDVLPIDMNPQLFYKNSPVDISYGTDTNLYPNGTTFLVLDTTIVKLPDHHSGWLWQCQECDLSFQTRNQLSTHNIRSLHLMQNFNTPFDWGHNEENSDDEEEDKEEEDKEEEYEDQEEEEELEEEGDEGEWEENEEEELIKSRRQRMKEAAREQNPTRDFVPDKQDIDWEKQVFARHIYENSAKFKSSSHQMHESVKTGIKTGNIPNMFQRQLPRTATSYIYGLRQTAQFYQEENANIHPGEVYKIHYRNFLDFGTNNMVRMASPLAFLKKWEGVGTETKRNFVASHNMLRNIVYNHADSAKGKLEFAIPYKEAGMGMREAQKKGAKDARTYCSELDGISKSIERDGTWGKYKYQVNTKRLSKEATRQKLYGDDHRQETIGEDVQKFIHSDFAIKAQDLILGKRILSDKEWVTGTRYLVTQIQCTQGSRREGQDMTVNEWENRQPDLTDPGAVTIIRNFTKLTGRKDTPTYLALSLADTALCCAYENAKHIKFPQLCEDPNYRHMSFFINSNGNAYMDGVQGNPLHLTDWKRITGRNDTPTSFRDCLCNFSLTRDEVTRANLAFMNNHSTETMVRIYASGDQKMKAGIDALKKYRNEQLHIVGIKNPQKIKLSTRARERQIQNQLENYDETLSAAVFNESATDKEASKKHFCNNESRAALIELCAAEIKTGVSVNDRGFLADILLRRNPKYINLGKYKVKKAILRVMDSPAYQVQARSLHDLLIQEARRQGPMEIDENGLNQIENKVLDSWLRQHDKMANPGISLRGWRIPAALFDIANFTAKSDYCLGNNLIADFISQMQKTRGNLAQTEQEAEEDENAMSPAAIIKLSRKTLQVNKELMSKLADSKDDSGDKDKQVPSPTDSPRSMRYQANQLLKEDHTLQQNITPKKKMPPKRRRIIESSSSDEEEENINKKLKKQQEDNDEKDKDNNEDEDWLFPVEKVLAQQRNGRLENWTTDEKVNLLKAILNWMKNPTIGRIKDGLDDIEENVWPQVTVNRSLDSVQTQYYRTGSPMYTWLKDYAESTQDIEWNTVSLRKNKATILDAYKKQFLHNKQ